MLVRVQSSEFSFIICGLVNPLSLVPRSGLGSSRRLVSRSGSENIKKE